MEIYFLIGGKKELRMEVSKVDTGLYIRLSPTVLFKAPECYGHPGQKDGDCSLCPVSKQCYLGVKPEVRG